ncbi:hypothetical protein [Niallia sp. 03133]|uniref:hypothetical protein n=1 Tax=Niallia sp. 03133 TaxID=3458060 RepID=UPI004044A289
MNASKIKRVQKIKKTDYEMLNNMNKSATVIYRKMFNEIASPFIGKTKQSVYMEYKGIKMIKNIPFYSISSASSIKYWNLSVGFLKNEQIKDICQIARILEYIPIHIDNLEKLINLIASRMSELCCLKGVVVRMQLIQEFFHQTSKKSFPLSKTIKKGIFQQNQSLVDLFERAL